MSESRESQKEPDGGGQREPEWTAGYGGRDPSELVEALKSRGVRSVVDVRLRPDQSRKPTFAKCRANDKGIAKLFGDAGIAYHSIVELGNVFIDCEDWASKYAQLLEAAGPILTVRLSEIEKPICLLCAERYPNECHRMILAKHLEKTNPEKWKFNHLE